MNVVSLLTQVDRIAVGEVHISAGISSEATQTELIALRDVFVLGTSLCSLLPILPSFDHFCVYLCVCICYGMLVYGAEHVRVNNFITK